MHTIHVLSNGGSLVAVVEIDSTMVDNLAEDIGRYFPAYTVVIFDGPCPLPPTSLERHQGDVMLNALFPADGSAPTI